MSTCPRPIACTVDAASAKTANESFTDEQENNLDNWVVRENQVPILPKITNICN
jgi:hypothetical protein